MLAPGFDLVVDYGIFTVLAAPLFWLLKWLHALIGNWGWAIVVMTILIKLAFYPLNAAAARSMAKMKIVGPKLKSLQEQYKNDKQQLQIRMMELYKQEKINPLGGCLPILVQIPFFIALYWVLLSAVELRYAPWVWLDQGFVGAGPVLRAAGDLRGHRLPAGEAVADADHRSDAGAHHADHAGRVLGAVHLLPVRAGAVLAGQQHPADRAAVAHEPHAGEGGGAGGREAALAAAMESVRGGVVVAALAYAAIAAWPALAHGVEDLDTPFVITPTNVVDAMLELADLRPGDRLIDLGSGDGRIVLAAAQRGATAVGIEIDANLVERSRESARRLKLADRATFVTQDLFEAEFAGYDVVTLYLLPDVNRRLAPKFLATLAPGTRIVSHDYGLGDWPPDATIIVDAPDKPVNVEKKSTLHFWRVPARLQGRWEGRSGTHAVLLNVTQRYQYVSGTLTWGRDSYGFTDQPLRGTSVSMRLATAGLPAIDVALEASGDTLLGTLRRGSEPAIPVSIRRR